MRVKCKKGFTIVEVIISIAILAILILVIGNSNITTFKINGRVRKRDKLFNTAKGICELYKAWNIDAYDGSYKKVYYNYNDIYDIEGLEYLFLNGDMEYKSDGNRYTLLLELSRLPIAGDIGESSIDINLLKVTVYDNQKGDNIVLTEIR